MNNEEKIEEKKMKAYDFTLEELENYIVEKGEKKFRGKQIYLGLYKELVSDYKEISTLKKDFAEELNKEISIPEIKLRNRQISSDETEKFLFELEDGALIETVLMKHNYGLSLCVSSQVGCPMACKFCASGAHGLQRNLDVYEMVMQVVNVEKITSKRISSVVVMGIGEPFLNFDNVLKFVNIINSDFGLAIGARHITISTCGLVPQINEFSNETKQINLAISFHASNDTIRDELMPINKKYPIKELVKAIDDYIGKTDRRVTIEYILLDNINDKKENALELGSLFRGMNVYINLIPYNETSNNDYRRSKRIDEFYDALKKQGLNVTTRKEQGHDIDAACGQLRSKTMNKKN